MSTLTIRNLEDEIKQALRERAASNGNSLEEEVRQTLRASVKRDPRPKTGAELLARIRAIVEPVGGIELDLPARLPPRKPPRLG